MPETNTETNTEFLPSEMCLSCPTRDIALFANVKPEDLHSMDSPITYQVLEKGGKLYEADEKAEYLYTMHDGVLKLEQHLSTGEQRILRLLKRGDLAGIEAVTADKYQHDAIAMTTISVCKIPAEIVLSYSLMSPELHANLLKKWSDALTLSSTWLTRLSTGPARYRIIRLLIWLSETCDQEQFILPGREDTGKILALTTETVSRLIAELRRDGVLEVLGHGHARADLDALKKSVKEYDT
jgi:CRP/FNR family transcriptional regulator